MNVNYDRVCRLCLSSRGELLPIFPTTSSDDSEPPVLASKIKDCVSVEINENDDLPTNVCKKCMDNVNNWHIFKSVCVKAQNKLESFVKDGSQLEEVKIKNEPLSDEAYDDGVVIDGSYPDIENGGSKLQPEGPPILASLGLTPRSDKKLDPRMDWHRVHAILDIVQDDDVIDSLQNTEEFDDLQHSDHNSDTEGDLQSDIDEEYVDSKDGYMCKNGRLMAKFLNIDTTKDLQRESEYFVNFKKRKLTSKSCPQPRFAWQMFFTEDLLNHIVESTNANISSSVMNVLELKTLIGILYFHGIMRPTHSKLCDLWHSDYGINCVIESMKYDRFKFLLQNIRFSQENDDSVIELDVMKGIRKVFEIFALNCRTAFNIDRIAVIDEIIVPVYGPCPFRYNIDSKPTKSGIKLALLVDPSNFYISNVDVIVDRYFGAEDVTKKMVQHLQGSWRTVLMDSWFTSLKLLETLKTEHSLFSIAAVKPTEEFIPPTFFSQFRKPQSIMTGYLNDECILSSYVTSQSKSINVVTNDPDYVTNKFRNVVKLYMKNKSCVEVVDVLMHYYTTMQHTNSWTLSLFFTLLNIAAVNSQVVWSSANSSSLIQRRLFLRELALSLMQNSFVNVELKSVKQQKTSRFEDVKRRNMRKRCSICTATTKRDRRTRMYCAKCGTSICKEHSDIFCIKCTK